MRVAVRLIVPLVVIFAIGGVSALASISTIAASDSCGGCDTEPTWAKVGEVVFVVGLAVWVLYAVVYVAVLIRRGIHRRA
jgi:hypothetical protein